MCLHHRDLIWQKYIGDKVLDRDQYEQALAACPDCFHEYLNLLENVLQSPPQGFVDGVMAAIPVDSSKAAYKPLMHYLIAASLTLIFIELGAFDWIGAQQPALNSDLISELLEALGNFFGTLKSNLGGM